MLQAITTSTSTFDDPVLIAAINESDLSML